VKRLALYACLSALGLPAFSLNAAAADLHIKAGAPYIIDASQANLSLDELVIDDKAQIKIADGVDLWIVSAKKATVGFGVVILGNGSDGRDGANGVSNREASDCVQGKAGGSGQLGVSGANGAGIYWSFHIASFGNVKVDLSGGNGGRGGLGGDGQNIPNLSGCVAAGGAAGSGGDGGDGGKGGSFRFHYTLADNMMTDLTNSIEVKISGGMRGKGGQAGLAGVGTSGHYADKTSRNWVAAGGDGAQGKEGRAGTSGTNGSLDIRRITEGASEETATEAPQNEAPSTDLEQKVKELDLLTQKLDARIRLLELDRK
jgi:hypothetical protein